MEKKVNGIVIKSVAYLESDKILTLFTLEEGVITAKIRGVKKAGAKLKACSEPFCFAEYVLASNSDRNTVTGASVYDGFYPLRENIVAFYAGSVVLEFLRVFGVEGVVNTAFFELAVNTLKELCYGNGGEEILLIDFLLKALKISGYGMELSGCASCGEDELGRVFFDSRAGAFYCIDCAEGSMEISAKTFRLLQRAELYAKGLPVKEDAQYLTRALKLIDFYIEDRIGEKLKALKDMISL